jgi:hypothetical protein
VGTGGGGFFLAINSLDQHGPLSRQNGDFGPKIILARGIGFCLTPGDNLTVHVPKHRANRKPVRNINSLSAF